MAYGDFQAHKRMFGAAAELRYRYKVHGLPENFNMREPNPYGITVEDGEMIVP